jgi:hypothetical protein
LSAPVRAELCTLALADRSELTGRLKAAGVARMGARLKVEMLLKESAVPNGADNTDVCGAAAAEANGAADAGCKVASDSRNDVPKSLAASFVRAESFAGRRTGYVFKNGSKGLGYYIDPASSRLDAAEAKLRRGFFGNMSWLSEDAPNAVEAPAETPVITPATVADTSAASTTTLALAGAPAPNPPPSPGRLSDARRATLKVQAGPFAPPLKDGKYAEKDEIVRVNGKHWALVSEIKTGTYYVRHLDGSGGGAHHFSELQTTAMKPRQFEAARLRWEARAPLARKTLQDDRRGHVHKSWTGPSINNMRLTDRSAPGKGYYAGVVPSVPLLPPPRIDSADVHIREATAGSSQGEDDGDGSQGNGELERKTKSEYYYAHRRTIDFKVPCAPVRIDDMAMPS